MAAPTIPNVGRRIASDTIVIANPRNSAFRMLFGLPRPWRLADKMRFRPENALAVVRMSAAGIDGLNSGPNSSRIATGVTARSNIVIDVTNRRTLGK